MLLMLLIMPLILAAAVSSILIYAIGMSVVSAFITGCMVCVILGWIIGELWGEDMYFSIVGWMATGYCFVAWIIAMGINYYTG